MKKYFYFKFVAFVAFVAFIIILLDKITQILFKKKNLKNFLPKILDIIEKKNNIIVSKLIIRI